MSADNDEPKAIRSSWLAGVTGDEAMHRVHMERIELAGELRGQTPDFRHSAADAMSPSGDRSAVFNITPVFKAAATAAFIGGAAFLNGLGALKAVDPGCAELTSSMTARISGGERSCIDVARAILPDGLKTR